MNRTKIEWTDFSWNPVTGCLHGCLSRGLGDVYKRQDDLEPQEQTDRKASEIQPPAIWQEEEFE